MPRLSGISLYFLRRIKAGRLVEVGCLRVFQNGWREVDEVPPEGSFDSHVGQRIGQCAMKVADIIIL